MITVKDIAKECKCSVATVSKAFNDYQSISKRKKNKIINTAKNMGYIPNAAARSLVTKKSHLLGIVLHYGGEKGFSHELFSKIINSFRNVVEDEGYDLIFLSKYSKENYSCEEKCKILGLEGVFCVSCNYDSPEIIELIKSKIPTVCFDSYAEYANNVSIDNEESVAQLVDYLASLGHKKILYVSGEKDSDVSKVRLSGFIKGMKRNGTENPEEYVVYGKYFNTETVHYNAELAVNSGKDFTAIMFPDDYTAIASIEELKKYGKNVPQDCSITGFDGLDMASFCSSSITTVYQNSESIGREAAKLLLDLIKNYDTCVHKIVDFKIIKGSSTIKID